jgi:uncharacterized membrane protein
MSSPVSQNLHPLLLASEFWLSLLHKSSDAFLEIFGGKADGFQLKI